MNSIRIIQGDCLTVLKTLKAKSIHCCVTSPPYWGLRDYGVDDQLGLEKTPEIYVCNLVQVFREVRRILRKDGTCWIVIGDSYAGSQKGYNKDGSSAVTSKKQLSNRESFAPVVDIPSGLKPKDLCMIPARVAMALQADGWWLRSDIIWHKPNPMPESCTDRPTSSYEHVFLLAKSKNYYYDADAIREPVAECSIERLKRAVSNKHKNINGATGQTPHGLAQPRPNKNYKRYENSNAPHEFDGADHLVAPFDAEKGRNKRSVWTVNEEIAGLKEDLSDKERNYVIQELLKRGLL